MSAHSTTETTEFACIPEDEQREEDASVIFFATITRFNESKTDAFIEVERVWKGSVPKETWIFADGLEAKEGSSYLIYGRANSSVDGFTVFPCATRETNLEEALLLLGEGEEPRDFVATFDTPFPMIDGSPLGISTNPYIIEFLVLVLVLGLTLGVVGTLIVSRVVKR